MLGVKDDIEAAGARLVFLGTGAPAFAKDFQQERVPGIPVYSDPSGRTYDALGAKHGLTVTLGPGTISAGKRAREKGFRQGRTQGKALQLGGVAVILPGDRVAWSYLSRFAGDHPESEAVVDAVRAAVARV